MRHLCDSNVLVAALVDSHPHHSIARKWLESLGDTDSMAICRATQTSTLRLLTLEAGMKEDTRTNSEALDVLRDLIQNPRSEWIESEPAGLEKRWFEMAGLDVSAPKLWMDAYLATFALGHKLRFVTFDRGFERFRVNGLDLLVLRE